MSPSRRRAHIAHLTELVAWTTIALTLFVLYALFGGFR